MFFFSPLSLYSFGVVVQLLSHFCLFTTTWTKAYQASLSFTISQSLLKLMAVESIMPSNHLIFCCPLLLLPSIFSSIRIFSNQQALCISIQRKSCSFLNGAKKKKIPQTSKQKQPKKQVSFCHRMWHSNSRCNNLVRNSWQLIQSFI